MKPHGFCVPCIRQYVRVFYDAFLHREQRYLWWKNRIYERAKARRHEYEKQNPLVQILDLLNDGTKLNLLIQKSKLFIKKNIHLFLTNKCFNTSIFYPKATLFSKNTEGSLKIKNALSY